MTPARSGASRLAASLALGIALAGCAMPPTFPEGPTTWAGLPVGAPPPPDPALRQALIDRASEEWEFFGRQTVVISGDEESIPHVGAWEDDDGAYSARVNLYWRAVGRPALDGMDCQQPWSAAFTSWVMQTAGVPDWQFPATSAHWVYMAQIVADGQYPGRFFVPRRVMDYSPNPGDLICATRGPSRSASFDEYTSPEALRGTSTHCDLVVSKTGQTLEAIGGNVRNSVSRSAVELDGEGRLQAVPRRPWFLILQNRL
jgi:hypothetical protein